MSPVRIVSAVTVSGHLGVNLVDHGRVGLETIVCVCVCVWGGQIDIQRKKNVRKPQTKGHKGR